LNSNDGRASESGTIERAYFRSIRQNGPASIIDFAACGRRSRGATGVDAKNEIVVAVLSDKPAGADHAARRVES